MEKRTLEDSQSSCNGSVTKKQKTSNMSVSCGATCKKKLDELKGMLAVESRNSEKLRETTADLEQQLAAVKKKLEFAENELAEERALCRRLQDMLLRKFGTCPLLHYALKRYEVPNFSSSTTNQPVTKLQVGSKCALLCIFYCFILIFCGRNSRSAIPTMIPLLRNRGNIVPLDRVKALYNRPSHNPAETVPLCPKSTVSEIGAGGCLIN